MERLISLCGLFVMVGLAWSLSSNRRLFNPRLLVFGILLQFALGMLILWTPPGELLFNAANNFFNRILAFVDEGSKMLFGVNSEVQPQQRSWQLLSSFAFGVLPTIVFFSSLMSVLYYLRLVQPVVNALAWLMQRTLKVSGAESLSAASNIFLGQTEAPLVIRPYLASMTPSEIYAVMVGGFANVAGSVMAAFVGMGIDGGHILTASVMSAPASLLIAKIMEPEIGQPLTTGNVSVSTPQTGANVLEAAADGASEGMKLALNVAAMLIAFLALADYLLGNLGLLLGYSDSQGQPIWSLAGGLSYVFAPLAWVMGIESKDCLHAGELLGIKTAANEFIAYAQLGQWIKPDSGVELSERSVRILTYALCGFSNFSSIGIQIGGIGGMVPERRAEIARFGLRAMIGGSLATFMTACVAGVLL